MSPSRSVLLTTAPAVSSVVITVGAGCPKSFSPTEITATLAPTLSSQPESEVVAP